MTNESKRDWENLLKPEDFAESELLRLSMEAKEPEDNATAEMATKIYRYYMGEQLSKIANEIIRKELEKSPVVYTDNLNAYEWLNNNGGTYHTHTAKLIQIEEIKRD